MKSILEAGFIFWGLFLIFGLIVVAYVLWMGWVERRIGQGEDPEGKGGPA